MKHQIVKVIVDRPLWTYHPSHKNIFYSVNYWYVDWVMWWDWEEQDAYILWITEPVDTFEWELIAIIHRWNDNEDKRVVVPKWAKYSKEEIKQETDFQEKYFITDIEML